MKQKETQTVNDQECKCICHAPGKKVLHCRPCCRVCEYCGKNIKMGCLEDHFLPCQAAHTEIPDDIAKSAIHWANYLNFMPTEGVRPSLLSLARNLISLDRMESGSGIKPGNAGKAHLYECIYSGQEPNEPVRRICCLTEETELEIIAKIAEEK